MSHYKPQTRARPNLAEHRNRKTLSYTPPHRARYRGWSPCEFGMTDPILQGVWVHGADSQAPAVNVSQGHLSAQRVVFIIRWTLGEIRL